MFKKESLLLALAMTAGLLTTAGCYTLIRHPVADQHYRRFSGALNS